MTRKTKKPATPEWPVTMRRLWAPMIQPKRGAPYFSWPDVRLTRRASREAFCENVPAFLRKEHLERVKFVRVAIVEESQP